MSNILPSRDWPRRSTPLNGDEDLLRQNPTSDGSSNPKEERIPTSLIKDYVLDNLPDDLFLESVDLVGSIVTFTLSDASTLTLDLSSLGGSTTVVDALNSSSTTSALSANQGRLLNLNDVADFSLSGTTLTIEFNDASTLDVDLSGLSSGGSSWGWYSTVKNIELYTNLDPSSWITENAIGEYTIVVPSGGKINGIAYLSESGVNRNSGTNVTQFNLDTSAITGTNTSMSNSFTPSCSMSPDSSGNVRPLGIGAYPAIVANSPAAGVRSIIIQGITGVVDGTTRIQINNIDVTRGA